MRDTDATDMVTEKGIETDTQGSDTGAAAHDLADLAQEKGPDGHAPVITAAASTAGGRALAAGKRPMVDQINLALPQRCLGKPHKLTKMEKLNLERLLNSFALFFIRFLFCQYLCFNFRKCSI